MYIVTKCHDNLTRNVKRSGRRIKRRWGLGWISWLLFGGGSPVGRGAILHSNIYNIFFMWH